VLSAGCRRALVVGIALAVAAIVAVVGRRGGEDHPAAAPAPVARAPAARPGPDGTPPLTRPAAARRKTSAAAADTSGAPDPQPSAAPPPRRPSTIGDLIVSGIDGTSASARLLAEVREGAVGGVILMGANIASIAQVRTLTASLQAAAAAGHRPPLLVMVDQEGGTVRRFGSAHPARSARSLAALPVAAVWSAGRAAGEDLLSRGVNVDLAPVVDVAHSERNFLGTRAFAGDPGTVARYGCAFAHGIRAAGALPTFKHFPGLGWAGATTTDAAPVTIGAAVSALQDDWAPYARCAADGPGLTMVSNAVYPALTGSRPAVIAAATYAAIRGLRFSGAIITDSLDAGSLRGIDHLASKAVRAGADLLLYTSEAAARRAVAELRADVRAGGLSRATVRDRAQRVRALRYCVAPLTRSRAAAKTSATAGSM
jgi:beta-N-acetylhexosaminidase